MPYGKYTIHLSFVQLMVRCVYPPPVLSFREKNCGLSVEEKYNYIYKI